MKHIVDHARMHKDTITWRGLEVSRIEAFSDSVFGFAITLLVVSLEVPKDFDDLLNNLSGFFALVFVLFSFSRFGITRTYFSGGMGCRT
ncbi:MAG TPA: TMEM175 family protein [Bacteroidia bacterium]|nr:TMEM175 family protein [Bacteroidia bacterium]